MILRYDTIETTKEELNDLDRTNPYNVIGAFIQTITEYEPDDTDAFYEKLQILQGDFQTISENMKQGIRDRMTQNGKYTYIGKSYFKGAAPENDYEPTEPYEIEVTENPYSNMKEGFLTLFVKSGGSDSLRGIMVRHGKDRNYYVWSDSFMGLLADIKTPESENAWE